MSRPVVLVATVLGLAVGGVDGQTAATSCPAGLEIARCQPASDLSKVYVGGLFDADMCVPSLIEQLRPLCLPQQCRRRPSCPAARTNDRRRPLLSAGELPASSCARPR